MVFQESLNGVSQNSYANKWLGFDEGCGVVLELNKPWDYSGYGDIIEIKEA